MNTKEWLLLCTFSLVAVISIATGVAVHNPEHYGSHSVLMAILITLGVEFILTTLGILFEIFE